MALIRREPLGVVGAVVPWNFPLDMATWKCAPALAAGNSVVLKPAEQSPLSALRLAELALEAGIPPGVLNVVPGLGETAGRALGLHHDVDCIAFTGSTEVGKLFLQYSAQSNMKQVWLECGGKSPLLIFADCEDLDAAADGAAFGIFFNQGEVCSATSRVLVDHRLARCLTEKLIERAATYTPGDPLDPRSALGAMVSESHTVRVMRYIDAARKRNTLVAGGNRTTVDGRGCFIEPTIFTDVTEHDPLALERVFGVKLFVRHHAMGLSITPAGRALLREARDFVRKGENLHATTAETTQSVRGTISVGCMLTLAPVVMRKLSRLFRDANPEAEIRQLAFHQEDLLEALRRSDIDVGFTSAVRAIAPSSSRADSTPKVRRSTIHRHRVASTQSFR